MQIFSFLCGSKKKTVYLTLHLHMTDTNKNFALKGDRINSEWHRKNLYLVQPRGNYSLMLLQFGTECCGCFPFIFPASRSMKLTQNYTFHVILL